MLQGNIFGVYATCYTIPKIFCYDDNTMMATFADYIPIHALDETIDNDKFNYIV